MLTAGSALPCRRARPKTQSQLLPRRTSLDRDQDARPDAGISSAQETERKMERIHITQHTSLGAFWFAGWLFSIGYLKLNFLMGLLGLVVWPYFLGSHFTAA